jgi:hypothetical protein
MSVLTGSYNYPLASLSAFIAVLASWTSLDLAERVTAARERVRLVWLVGGSVVTGIGIWSMHYTALLAFRLPVPVLYYWPGVLLALLAGIAAAGIALFAVNRTKSGWPAILAGSVFQGEYNGSALPRHGYDAAPGDARLFPRHCRFFSLDRDRWVSARSGVSLSEWIRRLAAA